MNNKSLKVIRAHGLTIIKEYNTLKDYTNICFLDDGKIKQLVKKNFESTKWLKVLINQCRIYGKLKNV